MNGMKIERKRVAIYARVSTKDQDPQNQLMDLSRFARDRGWDVAGEFVDHGVSGAKDSRPELNRLMDVVRKRKADVVLVWRFDRFARSTAHLLRSLEDFRALGVDFVSYQENIDTASALGQAIFTIVSAVAQLERDIIRDRVAAGLRKARSHGKRLGRPAVLVDIVRLKELAAKGLGVRVIGRELGVSRSKVSRLLSHNGGQNREMLPVGA